MRPACDSTCLSNDSRIGFPLKPVLDLQGIHSSNDGVGRPCADSLAFSSQIKDF
jgi:hypothetical protein